MSLKSLNYEILGPLITQPSERPAAASKDRPRTIVPLAWTPQTTRFMVMPSPSFSRGLRNGSGDLPELLRNGSGRERKTSGEILFLENTRGSNYPYRSGHWTVPWGIAMITGHSLMCKQPTPSSFNRRLTAVIRGFQTSPGRRVSGYPSALQLSQNRYFALPVCSHAVPRPILETRSARSLVSTLPSNCPANDRNRVSAAERNVHMLARRLESDHANRAA